MSVIGIGIDLVTVSEFAEQLRVPGTRMAELFTAGERRDAGGDSPKAMRHLAARWAAKEAVIKAWSGARFGAEPVLASIDHRNIEVVNDAWGRPSIRLAADVASGVAETFGDVHIHVSLTHDGDVAAALAVIEGRSETALAVIEGSQDASEADAGRSR